MNVFQRLAHTASKRHLTVLAYHGVPDADAFRSQLELIRGSFVPVSIHLVKEAVQSGTRLPDHSVLVTFDDGDRSWVDTAAPLMKEWGVPGVAFVVAGAVGSNQPYWWDQVHATLPDPEGPSMVKHMKRVPDDERLRLLANLSADRSPVRTAGNLQTADLLELEKSGIAIGNHTLTHPILTQCPRNKIAEEVEGGRRALESILGHPITTFAYPNGDSDATVRSLVAKSGHDLAFLFDHKHQAWPPSDPLHISRVRVNADDTVVEFGYRASGLHPLLYELRQRITPTRSTVKGMSTVNVDSRTGAS